MRSNGWPYGISAALNSVDLLLQLPYDSSGGREAMKRICAVLVSLAMLAGVGAMISVIAFSIPAAEASDSP